MLTTPPCLYGVYFSPNSLSLHITHVYLYVSDPQIVCVHELGHALGAYHEQQSKYGKGVIDVIPSNANDGKSVSVRVSLSVSVCDFSLWVNEYL